MIEVTPELLARHDRPGPRYTSYPTAHEFSEDYTEERHFQLLADASVRVDDPWSMYIHLPFCAQRCSFCACHVVVTRSESLPIVYLEAITAEAETVRGLLGDRRRVSQYHWGGGTPTFYPPDALRELFQATLAGMRLDPGAELSVEVDPRVTTPGHLAVLADLGFNRLSAGVQDTDQQVQRLIGRGQSRHQTSELIAEARRLGFDSINLDLVYGLPGQSESSLAETLEAVIELRPDRLAVYSFAYLPHLRPHQRRIDPSMLPGRETKFALLALLVSRLTVAGYRHIGMDHFALPEDDLAIAAAEGRLTRNFMGYTSAEASDVIALGTSGISEVDGVHAQNHRRLASYLAEASAGRLPIERGLVPGFDDRLRRAVINELMCNARVDLDEVGRLFAVDVGSYFAGELEDLADLITEGLAEVEGMVVSATPLGRLFIRRIAMAFDAHLQDPPVDRPRFSSMV